ncbi:Alternative oxidase, mitochondrial [Pseudolycoriella hygida]|uniref:Alternative oxidase, mitochondrial n=1 Tax=Pseudolycoriella hygida TaxID=35572 RepID=A0A9Q0RSF2_9DIPT|nr:Alternative oxidase, mitochondrial [Pseudolycoriella hygida]
MLVRPAFCSYLSKSPALINLLRTSFGLTNQLPVASFASKASSTNANDSANPKESVPNPGDVHFKLSAGEHPLGNENVKKVRRYYWDNPIPHTVYSESDLQVEKTHHQPKKIHEHLAAFAVKCMRGGFDIASRYKGPGGEMTKRDWLNRCLFLETVAGVPGMVAGMARHLKSLRSMNRDYGWIHTLLEEAENERMHLLIFMKMKDPGLMFRMMVIGAQGVFFNAFFLTYLITPKTCHRFVGYLEEEAVKTYTGLLDDMNGPEHLRNWGDEAAPAIAVNYYKLDQNATVRDVIKCIRADEAHHRDVNHSFAGLDPDLDPNPFLLKKLKEKK